MEILQAILLGIIEGITEFLPISSTGHLIVAQNLMGYKDTAEVFTVVIQSGAMAAVFWFFRKDLYDKFKGLLSGDKETRQFFIVWIIATLPALIAGYLLEGTVDAISTVRVIAWALLIGGVILWLIESYYRPKPSPKKPAIEKISYKQAVQVGLYQTLALVPGVSRSGATIIGGLLSGIDRLTATAFSFYMSMPVLVLAGGYKLIKYNNEIPNVTGGGPALIAGTAASFITAFFVIGWLLKYVARHDFKPFAYYRIILGLVILASLALVS